MKNRFQILWISFSVLILSACVTEKVQKPVAQTQAPMRTGLSVASDMMDRDMVSGAMILHGHARVQENKQILTADNIEVDKKAGLLTATDDVTYQDGKTLKKAQKMKFKMKNGNWIQEL